MSAGDWRALERTPAGATAPWFASAANHGGATDVKDAWEPGRFGWAYDLARGWMISDDDRYAEEFWRSLEAFTEACPPFGGVQWGCGQETAIRALALLWSEGALAGAPASTLARLSMLRTLLAWSGERIADGISYALSQRNNHGISEAAGLIAIGARLAVAEPRARRWITIGARHLERCVLDQFERDGWYLQHSFNYLRVALDGLVAAQRALSFAGLTLGDEALSRVRSGIDLLAEVTEPGTGEPPLHGANDGAWIVPLSTAAYRDFRPSLTAAAATFGMPLRGDLEPDEETLAWLGAPAPPRAAPPPVPRVRIGESGWVHGVTDGARLFARAGRYRSRPGHIDALHVDVWIDGRPVARDAGTYRYAAPAPWRNGLAGESEHNTLTLAEHPMATRGPRFLWLSWPSARIAPLEMREDGVFVVRLINESWAELGIEHVRTCELHGHGVLVVDRLTVPRALRVTPRVHWLVDGDAGDISVLGSGGAVRSDVVGDESSVRGWISEGYGHKREARSVQLLGAVENGRFVAVTGFGAMRDEAALRARLDEERSR